jgi:hypothetical protein
VDMARLLPRVAIGFSEDESEGNGRKEQRKRETNMVGAGGRSLESQVGLLVQARTARMELCGEKRDRAMSSLVAVAQCNVRAPVSVKRHQRPRQGAMTRLLPNLESFDLA